MSNINKFLNQWEANEKKLVEQQEKIIAQAASQVYKETVDRTPYGRPELWKMKAAPGYKPGDLRKAWEINWGTGFIHATASFTGKLNSVQGADRYKLGTDIYIRNQEDYAERVEYGYSSQAPGGMMRISVKLYQTFLNKATKNNKI